MNKNGDFNSILNVCSALKQEDDRLFNTCLNYPSQFTKETKQTLSQKGYKSKTIGDGSLKETLEIVLDTTIDTDEEIEEDFLETFTNDNNVCITIVSNDNEPVIYGNNKNKKISLFKTNEKYKLIEEKKGSKAIKKCSINVHANKELQVLWKVVNELDLTNTICNVIIDCEIKYLEQNWLENLDKTKEFIDNNGHLPSKHNTDPEIKSLGGWIGRQKADYDPEITKCKEGMKNKKRYKKWRDFINDEKYKTLFRSSEDKWKDNLDLAKEYITEYSKRPPPDKTVTTVDGGSLGTWISHQKTNYDPDISKCIKGMKNEEIYNLWWEFINDEKYNIHLMNNEEIWKNNLDLLKEFIQLNNILPSSRDKMITTIDGYNLGSWFYNQKGYYDPDITKCKKGLKTEELYTLWSDFINDEKYKKHFKSNEEIWKDNLDLAKEYIKVNNKLPPRRDKKILTVDGGSLGGWIGTQKGYYKPDITKCKQGMKTEEIYNLWRKFINNKKYKIHLMSNEEIWVNNLDLTKEYIVVNNKLPPRDTKVQTVDGGSLIKWIGTQKRKFTKCIEVMKNEDIYNLWGDFINDEKYKIHLMSNEEIWKNNLDLAKEYIKVNNKLPPRRDKKVKTVNGGCLGKWIDTQKRKYNPEFTKCIEVMKNEEIYNLWGEFINDEKYKIHLMSTKKDDTTDSDNEEKTNTKKNKKSKSTKKDDTTDSDNEEKVSKKVSKSTKKDDMVDSVNEEKVSKKDDMTDSDSEEDTSKSTKIVKKIKKYSDLTEEEQRAIIEKHLNKKQPKKGYNCTNPEAKDIINNSIANNIDNNNGKIIFLDHLEFKTAYTLLKKGINPLDMVIPQNNKETFNEMRKHEIFGECMIFNDFDNVLQDFIDNKELVNCVYADYTQCIDVGKKGIELISQLNLYKKAVIGVTITLRNPEGSVYVNSDITLLDREISTYFKEKTMVEINGSDLPYRYGNGAPMVTILLKNKGRAVP